MLIQDDYGLNVRVDRIESFQLIEKDPIVYVYENAKGSFESINGIGATIKIYTAYGHFINLLYKSRINHKDQGFNKYVQEIPQNAIDHYNLLLRRFRLE